MVEELEKHFLLSTDFGNKFPQFVNVVRCEMSMNTEHESHMDMKIVTRDMPENPYWKKYLILDHVLFIKLL